MMMLRLRICFIVGLLLHQGLYPETWHYDVVPVADIIQNNPTIQYQPCHAELPFEYKPFSLVDSYYWHPYKGSFAQTFILNIAQGKVFGLEGWILMNNQLIKEMMWHNCFLSRYVQGGPVVHQQGRVAVISQAGFSFYHHWLVEVLGKLALLEIYGQEYDYLYVPMTKPYMKESLVLWGIEAEKIISASTDITIEADELIVPSLIATAQTDGCPRLVHYVPDYILHYVREKLLTGLSKDTQTNAQSFAKKVFVSRKDAPIRRMLNEDEVFALFEKQGFVRYELSKLTFAQGIKLFQDADMIAGAIGSGLSNIVFCKPGTMVIDIFQAHASCTIGYIAEQLNLNYIPVKTQKFIQYDDGHYDTRVPVEIIQKLIDDIF